MLASAEGPRTKGLEAGEEGAEVSVLASAEGSRTEGLEVRGKREDREAYCTWQEVSCLGSVLGDDARGACRKPRLPPSSSGLIPTPRSATPMTCDRCGTTVSKKSIRAHKVSEKCVRLRRKRGWLPPSGKRAAEVSLQNPWGEKRLDLVPPACSSPASGGGGNGQRKALRPRQCEGP